MDKIKKITQIITAFSCVLFLCIGTSPMSVLAKSSTKTEDGLEVTLFTDKDSYNTGESIISSLKVRNTNDYAVQNVCLAHYIPDGYSIDEGSDESGTDSLAPGEEIILTVELKSTYYAEVMNTEELSAETSAAKSDHADDTTYSETVSSSTVLATAKDNNNTGNKLPVLCILAIAAVIAGIILCVMKKKSSSMFLIILCTGTVGMMSYKINAYAYDSEEFDEFISISDTIPVGNEILVIDGIVSYNYPKSEDVYETESSEDIYIKNAEEVIKIIDVSSSEKLLSEKEVFELMSERGFTDLDIKCEHDTYGKYIGNNTASENSDTKHPLYLAGYRTDDIVWTIYIIDDSVFAIPLSYNLENGKSEIIFSETDHIISYSSTTNKYYFTVPKSDIADMRKIERIDTETLDNIKSEDLEK